MTFRHARVRRRSPQATWPHSPGRSDDVCKYGYSYSHGYAYSHRCGYSYSYPVTAIICSIYNIYLSIDVVYTYVCMCIYIYIYTHYLSLSLSLSISLSIYIYIHTYRLRSFLASCRKVIIFVLPLAAGESELALPYRLPALTVMGARL